MSVTRIDTGAPFDIWVADLTVAPSSRAIAALSTAEQVRARRFRARDDERRYLAAHIALRDILSRYTSVSGADLTFESGPFGKPALAPGVAGPAGLDFNLSYAGDVGLVGVASGSAIGVDIEHRRPVGEFDTLVDIVFTPAECAAYRQATDDEAREAMFLRGWTRKESCIKAVGTGLTTEPASFESGLSADVRSTAIMTAAGRVEVEVGSFTFDRHVCAWARTLA